MLNKLKLILASTLLGAMTLAAPVGAVNLYGGSCSQAQNSPVCKSTSSSNPIVPKLKVATNILTTVSAIAAIVLIIYSGFNFVASGGNTEEVNKAKRRIQAAIIGLVIIAAAWGVINLAIEKLIQ